MNYEIEALKHCLLDNSNLKLLNHSLFTDEVTKYLYQKMIELEQSQGLVNNEILYYFLKQENKQSLISSFTKPPEIDFDTIKIILVNERNKKIISLAIEKINSNISVEKKIAELNALLFDFELPVSFDIAKTFDDTINEIINHRDTLFPIGIKSIDKAISLLPDRFVTIGGASGSGKTSFVVWLISKLCEQYSNKIYLNFISLEMSEKRIIERMISRYSNLSVKQLREELTKKNNSEIINKVLDIRSKVIDYPLEISYQPLDIEKLSNLLQDTLNKARKKKVVPMAIIDHFGEIAGLDETSSKQLTDSVTKVLKNFCMKGGIGIGLTQFRKDLISKNNKATYYRPDNSFIMNSQMVEARSDLIIHLWRPEHHGFDEVVIEHDNKSIEKINAINSICLINDKNREDAKKDIWLNCDIATNNFYEFSENKRKVFTL
jgi:replicative DNA helicase